VDVWSGDGCSGVLRADCPGAIRISKGFASNNEIITTRQLGGFACAVPNHWQSAFDCSMEPTQFDAKVLSAKVSHERLRIITRNPGLGWTQLRSVSEVVLD
jgi:hypothetical protein